MLASEWGIPARRSEPARLEVTLFPGAVLVFWNMPEGGTLIGFEGTPWHDHGEVLFDTKPGHYTRLDELDVLIGLASGDLVVVTRLSGSGVLDRWLQHKDAPLALEYMDPGEELRILRLPARSTGS